MKSLKEESKPLLCGNTSITLSRAKVRHMPAATPEIAQLLLIPIRKNLYVFLSGKTSVSIWRNPHFTHQP